MRVYLGGLDAALLQCKALGGVEEGFVLFPVTSSLGVLLFEASALVSANPGAIDLRGV